MFQLLIRNVLIGGGSGAKDLVIDRGRICRIGANLEVTAQREIDGAGGYLLPGFVDAHVHLDKALTAGTFVNRSGTLDEAIRNAMELKRRFNREDLLHRGREAIKTALSHGTCSMRTHVDIDDMVGLLGIEVLLSLKEEFDGMMDLQIVAFPQSGILTTPGVKEMLEEALRMGADVLGGIPVRDISPEQHIDYLLELASRYGVPLDLHVDESDNPDDFTLPYLASEIVKTDFPYAVTVGHLCSLAAVSDEQAQRGIDLLQESGIHVMTLPLTNLYLQGRDDKGLVRRGITRVRELVDAGINLSVASDNVQDPFNPMGDFDLKKAAWLLTYLAHFPFPSQMDDLLNMVTKNPAKAIGLKDYGLEGGCRANLVLYSVNQLQNVIIKQPQPDLVISHGKIVYQGHHSKHLIT
ncbi:MAG: amidohydrolase family protein [Bacillota bacterium]